MQSGEVEIEIGDLAFGKYDTIDIAGDTTFAGGTVRFEIDPSHLPSNSFSIDFLTASNISGHQNAVYDFSQLQSQLGTSWSFLVLNHGTKLELKGTYNPPGC